MENLDEKIESELQRLRDELEKILAAKVLLDRALEESETAKQAVHESLDVLKGISEPMQEVADSLSQFRKIAESLEELPDRLASSLNERVDKLVGHVEQLEMNYREVEGKRLEQESRIEGMQERFVLSTKILGIVTGISVLVSFFCWIYLMIKG